MEFVFCFLKVFATRWYAIPTVYQKNKNKNKIQLPISVHRYNRGNPWTNLRELWETRSYTLNPSGTGRLGKESTQAAEKAWQRGSSPASVVVHDGTQAVVCTTISKEKKKKEEKYIPLRASGLCAPELTTRQAKLTSAK